MTFLMVQAVAAVSEVPMLPSFFHGTATVNGEPAPSGSVITATIDGEEKGEIVITDAGIYGSTDSDNKLPVLGSSDTRGKTITFWIQVPGYERIQADEDAIWESGSRNELSLTFSGELTPDQSTLNEDEGDSGSSSGGGSSSTTSFGTSQTQVVNKNQFYFDYLEEGRQVDLKLADSSFPVTQIRFVPDMDMHNITIMITHLDEPQEILNANIYRYISIDAPKLSEDAVREAIIFFQVPNGWVKNMTDNITLYHYEGVWVPLETVIHGSGSDSTHHYYRARTYAFSPFAIATSEVTPAGAQLNQADDTTNTEEEPGESRQVETDEENPSTVMSDAESVTGNIQKTKQDDNPITGLASLEGSDPVIGAGIITLILLTGVLIYAFARSRGGHHE